MEQCPKKLLPDDFIGDRVRETIRRKHYSFRTEKSYVAWIRRYILFHKPLVSPSISSGQALSNLTRHPLEMGRAGVEAFLTYLAVNRKVSASTLSFC